MATAGASAVVAAPRVIRAQDAIVFKFQSTWAAKDIFNEYAQDYVNRVNEMAGGRLQLELLTAGTVVKAFELQQAVSDGILDGGHGVPAYWYGKHKGFSFFGTGPAFGFDANQLLGWFYYGGGRAFYDELVNDILGVNVVGFLTGPMATQPLGWFNEPVTGPEALNGRNIAPSASPPIFSPTWEQRSRCCPAAKSCRRFRQGRSMQQNSTIPPPTCCWALWT
jgi:TRAP-type mannitol/chloroaromatic compound transport system substrate-binding protein